MDTRMYQEDHHLGAPVEMPTNGAVGPGVDGVTPSTMSNRIEMPNAMFDWVPIEAISVDHLYQRPVNTRLVMQIADGFDPDVLGIVTLSRRDNGTYWAIDGQHRVAALAAKGFDGRIPAFVLIGILPEDEARIYYKTNRHRMNTNALDAFRARLAFSEPTAIGIKGVLDTFGLHVVSGANMCLSFTEVMAIAEVEQIYKLGLLPSVLSVIDAAWKGQDNAHKAIYLRGIMTFLATFRPEFFGDDAEGQSVRDERMIRLIDVLAKAGTSSLDARARFFAETLGATPSQSLARAIHDIYQSRIQRKSIKLSPWGTTTQPDVIAR